MKPEELFEKLIKNEISREEFETLLEGFDSEEIRARYDQYLESVFEQEMASHLEATEDKKQSSTNKGRSKRSKKGISGISGSHKQLSHYPIAAIILVFVGILFATLFSLSWFGEIPSDIVAVEKQSPGLITKSTPNRRMFRMRLEDGSFVHLNAVSQITYPQVFGEEKREIEISGEAYFDIERNESKPFNIKVKNHSVEVLGTSFNIKAYQDDEDFSVAVESGKVRIDLKVAGIDPVILTKDQKLIYSSESGKIKVLSVDTDQEMSWRNGILRFKSTPMAQVEKILERWYGVDVIIEDEAIYEANFTGSHQNENLKSVLETLTYATGTQYLIKNNSIIIKN